MVITAREQPVVSRAVIAYREAKKDHKGKFTGRTADQILEELEPSPAHWAALAAFVIASAEGATRRDPVAPATLLLTESVPR
jgi:hypothetical protein